MSRRSWGSRTRLVGVIVAATAMAACARPGEQTASSIPTAATVAPLSGASPPAPSTTAEQTAPPTAPATTTTTTTTSPPTTSTSTSTTIAVTTQPAPATVAPPPPPPTTAAPTTVASPALPACTANMPLRNQVALLTWPAIYMEHYTPARNAVRDEGLGGVLLMNVRGTAATLETRLSELKSLSPYGLVVATDEEGGDVQRLRRVRPLPSQQTVSTTMTTSDAYSLIRDQGEYMRNLGIDMVLGPVVDVLPQQGEPPLATSRFFAGDPSTVAAYADAYVKAWHDAGLGSVLKHFPGHGSATTDTHQGSSTTPPLAALEPRDLVPYKMLEGSGAFVMVGHLIVPDLTNGVPATRSPEAIDYLRQTLGYGDALVISDALDMGAVGLPPGQAAVDAIGAGIDVVLLADVDESHALNEVGSVIDAVVEAVQNGRLPAARVSEAANRVLDFLANHGGHCPSS